jgi:Spy/CpxP family protein refolding chaperone
MKMISAVAAGILSMNFAIAQPESGMGGRMGLMDDLSLTDQQKKQVEQIHDEAMRQGIDRKAEIAKARMDLRQLVRAEKPDQSAIEKKMKEIETLRSAALSHRLNAWFSVNKLLNVEQQKVWKKTLERRMEMSRRMEMRGRMQGRMRGQGMQRMFDGPMERGNR